jgi:hypothetical protein
MAIVINGSGTVTGISVGGLPDGIVDDGTLATDSVTAAKLKDDAIAVGDLPAGSVLQVVEGTTGTDTLTTSTSYVTTSLSASITPISASNKILVMVNGHCYAPDGNQLAFDVYEGTSITGKTDGFGRFWFDGARGRIPIHCCLLDSPSSTSSLTYTLYFKSIGGGEISFPNQPDDMKATITLMEVAG